MNVVSHRHEEETLRVLEGRSMRLCINSEETLWCCEHYSALIMRKKQTFGIILYNYRLFLFLKNVE